MLSQTFGFDVEIKIVSDVFEEKCVYSITPGLCDAVCCFVVLREL